MEPYNTLPIYHLRIEEARDFFYHRHDVYCNQKYADTLPYSFHLDLVDKQCNKFLYLLEFTQDSDFFNIEKCQKLLRIKIGIFGHDSIEDARMSYNELKEKYGKLVADIIMRCTEYTGETRDERKPVVFYQKLITNEEAVFVKLCDIIANTKFSLLTNSSMFKKYKKEYFAKVKPLLYLNKYKDMFDYLEQLYSIQND